MELRVMALPVVQAGHSLAIPILKSPAAAPAITKQIVQPEMENARVVNLFAIIMVVLQA